LLPDPEDVDDLVARLRQWRAQMPEWEARFERFGGTLRRYGWQDMARRIVAMANQQGGPDSDAERGSG
jgi:hypothetical protein